MNNIVRDIHQKAMFDGVPIMEDDALQYFISVLQDYQIESMLEIGTAVGYSSIAFALSNPQLKIVTVEKDEARHLTAKENIKKAELQERIFPVLMDARLFRTEEMFDCILLDGPKAHNSELLANLENNLNPGGLILVDDVRFHGFIDSPEVIKTRRLRTLARKFGKFRDELLASEKYDANYMEIGDGIIIAQKKEF